MNTNSNTSSERSDSTSSERSDSTSSEKELERLLEYRRLCWYSGDISYKFHSKQLIIWKHLQSNKWKEALFFISRQFGKSFLSSSIALSFAIRNPGTVVRIAAPTIGQAYDIVNDQLSRIISDAPAGLIKRLKSDLRWKVGQSEIRLGTVANAHIDTLRGTNASLIILEEGGFATSDEYRYAYRSVLLPQVTKTKGKILHVSSPSQEPEHFLHTDVLPRCESHDMLFRYTIYDNPFLSVEEIKELASMIGGEESTDWKREYLCQIVRDASVVCVPGMTQGLVTHVPHEPFNFNYVFGDWGGSRDKTVLQFAYLCQTTKVLKIYDELVFGSNTTTAQIVKEYQNKIAEWNIRPYEVVIDAPGQLIVDLKETHGIEVLTPAKESWHDNLNWLNVAVESQMLHIDPRCKFTIRTLFSGTFNKQKTDFARTQDLGHMDAIAALMYGVKHVMNQNDTYRYFDGKRRKVTSDELQKHVGDLMRNKFTTDLSWNAQDLYKF